MPTYTYKARDVAGKPVQGSMEAADKDDLIERLHKIGYMTTRVQELAPGIKIGGLLEKFQRVSVEAMIIFYVQFANMINAGISILGSLNILRKQAENKILKDTITEIARGIEAGENFSDALARHPRLFSNLFVSMVKAGEASGKLDNVLIRFAEYSEYQSDLRQKIKSALFYPAVLFFAAIAVIIFIVTFIMPEFAKVFIENGIALPLPTLMLYQLGVGIKQFWYLAILVIAAVVLAARYYINTERGRFRFDSFVLKLPVIGPLSRKAAVSRFSRTLSTLVGSGVPILQSLDIVEEVVGNKVLSRVVANARVSVEKGQTISEPLKVSGEFPQDAAQMILVGEESGKLDEMLSKISDFYNRAVSYAIKRLTALIEPVFLVVMGAVVGLIMASMLLPIFDMIKIFRR